METWGLIVIKDGHCMTAPFPVAPQAGPFFTSEPAADATLEAWFDDGRSHHDRLLPIARVSADGSIGALWRDDDGGVRAVVLGSEGAAYTIADDVRGLLALFAIGYRDFTPPSSGSRRTTTMPLSRSATSAPGSSTTPASPFPRSGRPRAWRRPSTAGVCGPSGLWWGPTTATPALQAIRARPP